MPFCLWGVPGAVLAAAPGAEAVGKGQALHTPWCSETQGLLCRLLPHHGLPGRCQCLGLWQYPKRCTSSRSATSLLPRVSVCLAPFARGTAEHCSTVWVPLEGQQLPTTAPQPDPARLRALGLWAQWSWQSYSATLRSAHPSHIAPLWPQGCYGRSS